MTLQIAAVATPVEKKTAFGPNYLIQETESYYKTNLDLQKKLPPLDFTHSFERFNRENENLEIEYLSEEKPF
ncbi:hypothetical protein [Bacillus sp. FSL K6-3431]|uniref:hypothetical protein n=1 Tax=Bacillus sp. FSL K6-3431 TaxID=2921500 RepID=UPI0030F562FB